MSDLALSVSRELACASSFAAREQQNTRRRCPFDVQLLFASEGKKFVLRAVPWRRQVGLVAAVLRMESG